MGVVLYHLQSQRSADHRAKRTRAYRETENESRLNGLARNPETLNSADIQRRIEAGDEKERLHMVRIFLCVPLLSALLWPTVQFMPNQDSPAQPPTASADNSQPPAQNSSPQDKAGANERIKTSILDLLKSDPVLDGADVQVSVDDHNIVLTGKVESYAQHQRVLQLVAQYGNWRKIVDQIKME
jgi:hypothetical protein